MVLDSFTDSPLEEAQGFFGDVYLFGGDWNAAEGCSKLR